jgi:hypothetical protein
MTYNCRYCKDTGRVALFIPGSWAKCEDCPTSAVAVEAIEADEPDDEISSFVVNGETIEIGTVRPCGACGIEVTEMGCERTWVLFEDHDDAGKAARSYYEDMARNDPEEFRSMVGDDTLSRWALGQSAGPGTAQVCSLSDWLDLYLNAPEEHFAGYDGNCCEVTSATTEGIEEIGFTPFVAFRSN